MSDVILIQPPVKIDWFLQSLGWITPNLGLPYLSAVLQKNGYTTTIIDAPVEKPSIKEILIKIKKECPKLIGFTAHAAEFESAKQIAKLIKQRWDIPIIIGGSHAHFLWNEILAEKDCPFDFCARGEGEESLILLMQYLAGQFKNIEAISGLCYKIGESIKSNEVQIIERLDDLPYPSLKSLDGYPNSYGLDKYIGLRQLTDVVPVIPILSSRGCNGRCTFCQVRVKDGPLRPRSALDVYKETSLRISEYNINFVYFADDNFTEDSNRVLEFCRLIEAEDLKFSWAIQTRIDWVCKNKELVQVMRKCGCIDMYVGVESMEPSLSYYRKGITIKDIIEATTFLKSLDIIVTWCLIIGSPFDTRDNLFRLKEFIFNQEPDYIQLMFLTPLPGTPIFEEFKSKEKGISLSWADCDGQTPYMAFNGSHEAAFLQSIRDDIIKEFYGRISWWKRHLARFEIEIDETFNNIFKTEITERLTNLTKRCRSIDEMRNFKVPKHYGYGAVKKGIK